jgi:hypothetical protein
MDSHIHVQGRRAIRGQCVQTGRSSERAPSLMNTSKFYLALIIVSGMKRRYYIYLECAACSPEKPANRLLTSLVRPGSIGVHHLLGNIDWRCGEGSAEDGAGSGASPDQSPSTVGLLQFLSTPGINEHQQMP